MPTKRLNEGSGICQGTACVVVRPTQSVIDLGAFCDVLSATLQTVHTINRRGEDDDRVAIVFPEVRKTQNALRLAPSITLVGSQEVLNMMLSQVDMTTLCRRGMLDNPEVIDVPLAEGDLGLGYIRNRRVEKRFDGELRRRAERRKRRGLVETEIDRKPKQKPTGYIALSYGKLVLNVTPIVGRVSDAPLLVNTYGFSSTTNPAIFAVPPQSAALGSEQ